jgi:hypothetical protein
MRITQRRWGTVAAGLAIGAVAIISLAAAPGSAQPPAPTYEVTIANLTSGQPLTPPVAAVHRGGLDVFDVGSAASFEVQQVAENGNAGPLLETLGDSPHVSDFLETTTGPLVPAGLPGAADFDDSVTFTLSGAPGVTRLTFVSMLICTNDGFTGLDRVKLPSQVGDVSTYRTLAYNAGTEIDTEDLANMVPPCQGLAGVTDDEGAPGTGTTDPALAEGGVIHHHAGIQGIADLDPDAQGWDVDAPVAEIVIERVD